MKHSIWSIVNIRGFDIDIMAIFATREVVSREPYEHFGAKGRREESELIFDGFDEELLGYSEGWYCDIGARLRRRGFRKGSSRYKKRLRYLRRKIGEDLRQLRPQDVFSEEECLAEAMYEC